MPPKNEDVLVSHIYWRRASKMFFSVYLHIAKRSGDNYFDSNTGKLLDIKYEKWPVTHWAPIPDLPKY